MKLKERVGYAVSKGGFVASLWWILKSLTGVEAYRLFTRDCTDAPTKLNTRFVLRSLRDDEDAANFPSRTLDLLASHSGRSVAELLDRRITLYLLTDNDNVVCQLQATCADHVQADTPRGLCLGIGKDCAFISYVYTHERYRRMGAAAQLLTEALGDLRLHGTRSAFAHVSATNVPSLRTFAQADWKTVGLMVFDKRGKLLFTRQPPHVKVVVTNHL